MRKCPVQYKQGPMENYTLLSSTYLQNTQSAFNVFNNLLTKFLYKVPLLPSRVIWMDETNISNEFKISGGVVSAPVSMQLVNVINVSVVSYNSLVEALSNAEIKINDQYSKATLYDGTIVPIGILKDSLEISGYQLVEEDGLGIVLKNYFITHLAHPLGTIRGNATTEHGIECKVSGKAQSFDDENKLRQKLDDAEKAIKDLYWSTLTKTLKEKYFTREKLLSNNIDLNHN